MPVLPAQPRPFLSACAEGGVLLLAPLRLAPLRLPIFGDGLWRSPRIACHQCPPCSGFEKVADTYSATWSRFRQSFTMTSGTVMSNPSPLAMQKPHRAEDGRVGKGGVRTVRARVWRSLK